jgi:predicted nucleic acid-binding protein
MSTGQILLLDACVVINLEATSRFDDIARSRGEQFVVVRQASAEVGSLRADVDGVVQEILIDLAPHVAAKTLSIADLEPDELALYVDLARDLDDGEAASIAIAVHRGLRVATDDKKARRVCLEQGLAEPVRTSDLLREFCDQNSLRDKDVGDILRRVRDLASFVPPRSDPNRDWWATNIGD